MIRIGPQNRIFTIPGIGLHIITPGGAANPWYDPDGSIGCCIAAYQPKSAADYVTSKVNLANPGTYDATEGVAPGWDAVNGWVLNGATNYLRSGITPTNDQTWSMIVRHSNLTIPFFGALIGCFSNPRAFSIGNSNTNRWNYRSGAVHFGVGSPIAASGVVAIAGTTGYLNGVSDYINIPASAGGLIPIFMGCLNNGGVSSGYSSGNIQAVAVYSCTLTAPQVLTVSTAMAAL